MTDNIPNPAAPATPEAARWLALGAVAGPALFTFAWFVLGFLSPGFTIFGTLIAPYSPISQPISGLGLGTTLPGPIYCNRTATHQLRASSRALVVWSCTSRRT